MENSSIFHKYEESFQWIKVSHERINDLPKPQMVSPFTTTIVIFDRNPREYLIQLCSESLFCVIKKEASFVFELDIENSILEKQTDHAPFRLSFTKKGNTLHFETEELVIVENWFERLKKFCIQKNINSVYKFEKVIDSGGFGLIVQGSHLASKMPFGIKIFSKNKLGLSELNIKSLMYEIKVMRLIKHPNIMTYYEAFESDNSVYLVVELFKGPNLRKVLLEKGKLPPSQSLYIMNQLFLALDYLHEFKIVHRDIKPSNIVFKEENKDEIGLVDFGFASFERDLHLLTPFCGTVGHMAPEVLREKPYNTKADVFAAGITFYRLLTGKAPFSGESPDEILRKNYEGNINFDFKDMNVQLSEKSELNSD